MGKYDVNFIKLIKQSLPMAVRGNLVVFIYVLIAPIRYIYNKFITEKEANENSLSYNSQYPNLQRLLNDRFDYQQRRIKVKDGGGTIPETLISVNEELKPWELGLVPIHHSSRWGVAPFTVLVPNLNEFKEKESRIKRTVDSYKFSGTKYEIIYE